MWICSRVSPAYALAEAPTRLNQPQTLGNVTNANSPTPYRDEPFGPDFAASVFISEPIYNVVDRFVLDHPEWIAPDTQSRMDLRAGANTGRIWRVFPTGRKPRKIPSLANLDEKELAPALDSPSAWQRDTVQRLFIQNQSAGETAKTAAPILRKHLRAAKNPKVRVQAIATLVTLDRSRSLPSAMATTSKCASPSCRPYGPKMRFVKR